MGLIIQRSEEEEYFRQKKQQIQHTLQPEQADETGTKGVREKVREDATGGSGRGQITKNFRFSPSVPRSH